MVTVVVNGAKQIQSLKIDPEVVSKDDVEMLQDLIVAAVNDAHRKADEEMARSDWPFTSSKRRARTPTGSPTLFAASRNASPTARSATTSPTPTPAPIA